MAEKVHVKVAGRVVGIFPPAAIEQMQAKGLDASMATAEEAEEYEIRKEAGTAMGQLKALGGAAASGVTLGLYDLAVSDRKTKQLREMTPGTGFVEALGAIGPVLATGGTGAAGRGLLAGISRLTPAAMAARAGTAAGRAVSGAIGTGAKKLSGKVIQAAAPLAAAAGTETALYSGGAEISESALGGVEQSAERIVAAMGTGAVLGGVLGAGLGVPLGVGKALKDRVVSKAQSLELDKVVAEAADAIPHKGIGKKVTSGLNKASAVASGVDQSAIEKYGMLAKGDDAKAFGREALEFRSTADEMATATFDVMDDIQKGDDIFERTWRGDPTQKERAVRETIEKEMVGTAKRAGRRLLDENLRDADMVLAELPRFDSTQAKTAIKSFHRNVKSRHKAATYGRSGKMRELDYAKTYVTNDAIKAETHTAAKGLLQNRLRDPTAKRELIIIGRMLEDIGDRNMRALERVADYGAMGTKQAATNKHYPDFITAKTNLRGLMSRWYQTGLDVRPKELPDLSRIKGELGKMSDIERAPIIQAMEDYVNKGGAVVEMIMDGVEVTVSQRETLKGIRASIAKFKPVIEKFKRGAASNKIVQDMMVSQRMGLGGVIGQGAMLTGALVGGVPGAALGAGLNLLLNPAHGVMLRASAQRAMDLAALKMTTSQVGQQLTTSAKALVRMGKKTGEAVRRGARATGRGVSMGARLGRREVERQIGKTDAERRARFERDRRRILRMANDPQMLQAQVANATEAFSEAAPRTAQLVGDVTQRGVQFLSSKMPAMYSIDPVYRGKVSAAPSEISRWNRYHAAVDKPMKVLGRPDELLPEHVEALEAVYPTLLDEYKRKVVEEFVRSGQDIPYAMRVRIGALLHLPLDPSLAQMPASEVGAPEAEPAPVQPRGPTTQLAASQVRTAQAAGGSLSTGTDLARTSRHPRMA